MSAAPKRNKNENTTQPTEVSVTGFLEGVDDPAKRADCDRLIEIMSGITGEPATMWGPSVVGFGSYHYRYASGREGDMPVTGFSPRQAAITLYLMGDWDANAEILDRLGKHKLGKGCLYIKRLADVDEAALSDLIASSVRRYS